MEGLVVDRRRVVLPAGNEAPGVAREAIGTLLVASHLETTEAAADAELLTSELVTDAVLHYGPPVELHVEMVPRLLMVNVISGQAFRSDAIDQVPSPDDLRTQLLDKLALAWGLQEAGPLRGAWFAMDFRQPDSVRPREAEAAESAP